jgi:hypothetical protein
VNVRSVGGQRGITNTLRRLRGWPTIDTDERYPDHRLFRRREESVQVELPGPFTPDHDREVSAYVDAQISAAELYRRTVARYRQP